jgi:hypothetical protein
MSEWGGTRTPAAPAVVSAPGALSSRTDGGVLNPKEPEYGERQALENLASAAPLATTPSGSPQAQAPVNPMAALTSLSAPTARPGEPVTAGAAVGAGPGVDVLGLPRNPGEEQRSDAAQMSPGMLQALIAQAQSPDASPSFRRLVRQALYS